MLVQKETSDLKLYVDFRELNKITIYDNFPTKLINNIDCLQEKKILLCHVAGSVSCIHVYVSSIFESTHLNARDLDGSCVLNLVG